MWITYWCKNAPDDALRKLASFLEDEDLCRLESAWRSWIGEWELVWIDRLKCKFGAWLLRKYELETPRNCKAEMRWAYFHTRRLQKAWNVESGSGRYCIGRNVAKRSIMVDNYWYLSGTVMEWKVSDMERDGMMCEVPSAIACSSSSNELGLCNISENKMVSTRVESMVQSIALNGRFEEATMIVAHQTGLISLWKHGPKGLLCEAEECFPKIRRDEDMGLKIGGKWNHNELFGLKSERLLCWDMERFVEKTALTRTMKQTALHGVCFLDDRMLVAEPLSGFHLWDTRINTTGKSKYPCVVEREPPNFGRICFATNEHDPHKFVSGDERLGKLFMFDIRKGAKPVLEKEFRGISRFQRLHFDNNKIVQCWDHAMGSSMDVLSPKTFEEQFNCPVNYLSSLGFSFTEFTDTLAINNDNMNVTVWNLGPSLKPLPPTFRYQSCFKLKQNYCPRITYNSMEALLTDTPTKSNINMLGKEQEGVLLL